MENSSSEWLKYTAEIKPGHSAVLGGNYSTFYTIHYTATCLLITSLISCALVIISILLGLRKERQWDFSDRFPMYLAIADFLWSLSHLSDHLVLLVTETYSEASVAPFLSINIWFFLGYKQYMHAGLAIYIYLKVVRRKSLDLGVGEWKLHAICVTIVTLSIVVFLPLGSFGCTGYWYIHDVKTTQGIIMGFYVATSASLQAFCTTMGYRSIAGVIKKQNKTVQGHRDRNTTLFLDDFKAEKARAPKRHSVATKCLTTFVRISITLYCTLSVAYWSFVIQTCFGIMEPFTVLLIVIVANSSGWANAVGYFYNRRIKAKNKAAMNPENVPIVSDKSGE